MILKDIQKVKYANIVQYYKYKFSKILDNTKIDVG